MRCLPVITCELSRRPKRLLSSIVLSTCVFPLVYSLVGLFLALLLMESVADEQHFQFQTLKHSLKPQEREKHTNVDVRRGFFTTGLFSISRHPNYFAEQSMWVVVYAFSVSHVLPQLPPLVSAAIAAGAVAPAAVVLAPLCNWTVSGCIQLILLFQGSMTFGESITVSKYPDYRYYQRVTSRCIPGLPHGPLPAPSNKAK